MTKKNEKLKYSQMHPILPNKYTYHYYREDKIIMKCLPKQSSIFIARTCAIIIIKIFISNLIIYIS